MSSLHDLSAMKLSKWFELRSNPPRTVFLTVDRRSSDIEHIWQVAWRLGFYRGGAVFMSAISGIDIALWDLKGDLIHPALYLLFFGHADIFLRFQVVNSAFLFTRSLVASSATKSPCMRGSVGTARLMSLLKRRL